MTYQQFIAGKGVESPQVGIDCADRIKLNPSLFDFQRDIVRWSLRRGSSAIFADCGLGKTLMQLEWARVVSMFGDSGAVLIAAPLSVAQQTVAEGKKFGIDDRYLREPDGNGGIVVTNYEMLPRFNPAHYDGIVLDESSILKSYEGKFKQYVIREWGKLRYKLACTATPAPNDFMELGNHSEFVGAMTRSDMLSTFFIHDSGETAIWRLKGHAEDEYWRWMASWSVMLRSPGDLGYEEQGFDLPPIYFHEHKVDSNYQQAGWLFPVEAKTMEERRGARRASLSNRVWAAAQLANSDDKPWLVWCDLNDESAALKAAIRDSVEVKGSDPNEDKEDGLVGFAQGRYRVLISKPSIAGFGMNYQHCANQIFTGLSDSYEQFYQAVRRCWRFGQKNPVNVHVVIGSQEGAVLRNISRKDKQSHRMISQMLEHTKNISSDNIRNRHLNGSSYKPSLPCQLPNFIASTSQTETTGNSTTEIASTSLEPSPITV